VSRAGGAAARRQLRLEQEQKRLQRLNRLWLLCVIKARDPLFGLSEITGAQLADALLLDALRKQSQIVIPTPGALVR